MEFVLELTKEELEALDQYALKKLRNLEISNLTDTTCYQLFCKIHYTIIKNIN